MKRDLLLLRNTLTQIGTLTRRPRCGRVVVAVVVVFMFMGVRAFNLRE